MHHMGLKIFEDFALRHLVRELPTELGGWVEHLTGYHSADGRHFLGWRHNQSGGIEVIHDVDGRRQVFKLMLPPRLCAEFLSKVLAEAVRNRNVVAALHRQLSAHQIGVASEDIRG
jgi:hypothetical protein